MSLKFELLKTSTTHKGRAGILHTKHGSIETPVFMPVGTQATVKGMTPEMVSHCQADIILANTYHLVLRPGANLIEKSQGLHTFMNWHKPILTDSGGFQVFSLNSQRKILKEGVRFKSHIDGSSHLFTPKNVIDFQRQFESDIMMPLDICTAYTSTKKQVANDLAITHQWEKEALAYWQENTRNQWLFAITQGGMHKDLRQQSVETLSEANFPGYAIGGLSVGEPTEILEEYIAFTTPLLPEKKPRYIMGLGLPQNLEFAIKQGADMFDSVLPTRLARHGQVFSQNKRINIKQHAFKEDLTPIDATCTCYTCQHYTKAYLRHLFIAKEMLGATLMSIHNIYTLIQLTKKIRNEILLEKTSN